MLMNHYKQYKAYAGLNISYKLVPCQLATHDNDDSDNTTNRKMPAFRQRFANKLCTEYFSSTIHCEQTRELCFLCQSLLVSFCIKIESFSHLLLMEMIWTSTGIRAWTNNYCHEKQWDAITCPCLSSAEVKLNYRWSQDIEWFHPTYQMQ